MVARLAVLLAFAFALAMPAAAQTSASPDNILVLETNKGTVEIALRPDLAPQHVARIKELAREGFYDGVVFHRVIDGFMAQTGDPTGTGGGGSKLPDLKAEFTATPFERGTVGMARTAQSTDTANSQFFIMFSRVKDLDGQYTVFGEVIDGMDVVDTIKKGSKSANGQVANPDKIVKAYIKADK
jgi:peptidylprolyl isomerase